MVSYDTVSAQLNSQWNVGVIQKPTFVNKAIRYSAKYPHYLFLRMYEAMPMKMITQSNDGGLVKREQFFELNGVYATFADARKGLQESKRIITEYKGWYIRGKGKIIETRRRFVFLLPCYELAFLQKSDW